MTVAGELLIEANLASASFALLASTPVPAANPITAADRMAIITERTNTNTEHPHIFFCAFPVSDGIGPYPD